MTRRSGGRVRSGRGSVFQPSRRGSIFGPGPTTSPVFSAPALGNPFSGSMAGGGFGGSSPGLLEASLSQGPPAVGPPPVPAPPPSQGNFDPNLPPVAPVNRFPPPQATALAPIRPQGSFPQSPVLAALSGIRPQQPPGFKFF